MTDRELLERAAKAAGIVLFDGGPEVSVPAECQARVWLGEGKPTILFYSDAGDNPLCKRVRPSGNVEWNPLEDDGDALRLAVKLRMEVHIEPGFVRVWTQRGDCVDEGVDADGRAAAATRRCIVRAAASMAEGGKE